MPPDHIHVSGLLLMLVSVFAAPTTYSEWIIFLFGHLLDCKYGAHYHIIANTPEDVRAAWDGRNGRVVLVTTDWPDTELARLLTGAGFPSAAVVDEPLNTVLARSPHMDFVEAVRVTTGHFATLSAAFRHNRLVKIDTRYLREPVENLLDALVLDLFGATDRNLVEAVAARVSPAGLGTRVQDLVDLYHGFSRDLDALLQPLTKPQRAAALAIARSYGQLLQGGTLQKVEWPLELFNCDMPENNLIGGGRTIVSGPFLCLPTGIWRVTIQCETAENYSGNEIGIEIWFPPETLATRGYLSLPERGIYNFSLNFEVVNPASRVELTIYLLKGAIEGKFKLRSVTVERVGETKGQSCPVLEPVRVKTLAS